MRYVLRFMGFAFTLGAILFVVAAAAGIGVVWHYSKGLPDYTQLASHEPSVTTRVHAADGAMIAEYAKFRRLYLPIQAVPQQVVAAFLSAEDKNFYKHRGLDPEGIIRAALQAAKIRGGGSRQQGASTITQQVAKNFLLSNDRTFERKIREMLVAVRIEATYSKNKILELYLNEIYLGAGNYGIAAAALNYFGKSVHELEVHETAYLAALPKGPENYHPIRNREQAISRRNYVLDRMAENGYLTKAELDAAKKKELGVTFRSLSPNSFAAGYFAEEVRRELADRYGFKKLYEGGLSVRTTLDPELQKVARRALVDGLVRFDEARGWRGPVQQASLDGREWGVILGELPAYGDVQPWRLAYVFDATDTTARIGLQPKKLASGQLEAARETGFVGVEGVKWTRKSKVRDLVKAGDVVYVEPLEGKPGEYRLRQIPEVSGALVAMDPFTGRVVAMVGGFSFDQSEFNRATQAYRQPGSSFKPFVYATALDNGYTPSSVIMDTAIEVPQADGEVWKPENYDGVETGPRTLRQGIEKSKNLMTVRLAQDLGMPLVVEYAKRFGIYDEMSPVLAMSLGAGETTVLRMTAGFSMFANGGRRIKPTLIDRIQDRWGATIYKHDERACDSCGAEKWDGQNEPRLLDKREVVIDPHSAYQITSIMQGVIQRGTATSLKSLNRQYLAGKTGTTNDAKDVWFVGFSANLAVGVYMGFDKPKSLGSSATAGQYAAPIFGDFMKVALAGKPDTPFRVPPGIKLVRVAAATGVRATGKDTIMEAFKPGSAPPDTFSSITGLGNTPKKGGNPEAVRALGTGTGGLY